eukprot:15124614-Heterocapsa_arctica.AAC.1
MLMNGLRASSLSPFDSSQNADHVAQHLSLRPMFELQTRSSIVFVDAHGLRKTPLSCTPVRVHL